MTAAATNARTVSATLPNGVIARRATTKDYTKLVAAKGDNNFWFAYSWASTPEVAKKREKDAHRAGYTTTQILDLAIEGQATEQAADYDASSREAGQLVNVAPIVSLKIVRDAEAPIPAQVRSPSDLYAILRDRFADADRENFVVLCLDTKNRVIAINIAFVGTLNSCSITLREVFKAAIAVGAAAIAIAHNHPSGDPQPSPEDVALTREIRNAGNLLDIEVIDHITLGSNGRWVSFRERGFGF